MTARSRWTMAATASSVRRRRSRMLVLALAFAWWGFTGAAHAQTGGQLTTVESLTACIRDSQGRARFVESGATCRRGETKVELVGEQGPIGPAGPAGPPALAGVPAICESQCSRGTLEVHFTETDRYGDAVCPAEPALVLHCDPYACDPDNGSCRKTCNSDEQCRPGSRCCTALGCLASFGQCLPYVWQCNGGQTLIATNGDTENCYPYRCTGSRCRETCTSTAHCASGTQCDAEGNCVLP